MYGSGCRLLIERKAKPLQRLSVDLGGVAPLRLSGFDDSIDKLPALEGKRPLASPQSSIEAANGGFSSEAMYNSEVIGGDALAMRRIAPSYAEGNHTLSSNV